MGGILSSLNNSYTGLKSHQVLADVTGNNISNANNEFYSRQRVDLVERNPIKMPSYVIGQGVEIQSIERVFDDFVFNRLKTASNEKEYSYYQDRFLREASRYFPDVDNVGIYNDIKNFFDSWKNMSISTDDPAQKEVLGSYTETLGQSVRDLRSRLIDLQKSIYEDMKISIYDINRMGEEIAEINKQIRLYEEEDRNMPANALRDRRDQLEMKINDLIGADVFKKNIQKHSTTSTDTADFDENFTMMVGGATIVDGINFHPLKLVEDESSQGFYEIYYERQDGTLENLMGRIDKGRVGSAIDLARGRSEGQESCDKYGKIQTYIDDLDTFAAGFIESVNNIYATSAQKDMVSDGLDDMNRDDFLVGSNYHIDEGTFDINMYSSSGETIATRTITIDRTTTLQDLLDQINANIDDNENMNGLDDFDDKFTATFNDTSGIFQILPDSLGEGLYFNIADNGTNFAGAIGLSRFMDGNDAMTIDLTARFKDEPTQINAYSAPAEGNTVVANMMQQLQYEKVTFHSKDGFTSDETIQGFFRSVATKVGTNAENANVLLDTRSSVYTSVKKEHSSISEVNIDEELTNLIRFQAGYSANAKVITTIDQMINTLLGIKQ
jgi:flagellar hook-associated protein 1 FlgK